MEETIIITRLYSNEEMVEQLKLPDGYTITQFTFRPDKSISLTAIPITEVEEETAVAFTP